MNERHLLAVSTVLVVQLAWASPQYAITNPTKAAEYADADSWFTAEKVSGLSPAFRTDWAGRTPAIKEKDALSSYTEFKGGLPEVANLGQYIAVAKLMVRNCSVTKKLDNGDHVYYDRRVNLFCAASSAKKPIALFRPIAGKAYYDKVHSGSEECYPNATEARTSSVSRAGAPAFSDDPDFHTSRQLDPVDSWITKTAGFQNANSNDWSKSSDMEAMFKKYGPGLPSLTSPDLYARAAFQLYNDPPEGTKERILPDGDKAYYLASSNVFARYDQEGKPKFLARPRKDNYFAELKGGEVKDAQKPRSHYTLGPARENAPLAPKDPRNNKTLLGKCPALPWVVPDKVARTPDELENDHFVNQKNRSALTGVDNVGEYRAVGNGMLAFPHEKRKPHVTRDGDIRIQFVDHSLIGIYDWKGRPKYIGAPDGPLPVDDYPPEVDSTLDTSSTPPLTCVGASGKEYKTTPLKDHRGEHAMGSNIWEGYIVRYFSPLERRKFEVFVDSAKRLVDSEGEPLDTRCSANATSSTVHENWAIFVMDRNGRIYCSKYSMVAQFHHSSFLSGASVAAAGEIKVLAGKIQGLNNRSGHYKPDLELADQLLDELYARGVDISALEVKSFE